MGGGRTLAWGAFGALTVAGLVVGLLQFEDGPTPPYLEQGWVPPVIRSGSRPADQDHILALAGSGSNLEVTRELAKAFAESTGHLVFVHESIGSRGAIEAMSDGMVDVGLISRPLRASEAAKGLRAHAYSRQPVLVTVNASVRDTNITRLGLVDLYAGRRKQWSDGTSIVVLQREEGDSSHRAVDRVVQGFAAVNQEAWDDQRYAVLYHDGAMREALASTPAAVGLHAGGLPPRNAPLRALNVDGVEASPENVRSRAYPFWKDLSFVTYGEPQGMVRDFLEFVASGPGRQIITDAGQVPLQPGGALWP